MRTGAEGAGIKPDEHDVLDFNVQRLNHTRHRELSAEPIPDMVGGG